MSLRLMLLLSSRQSQECGALEYDLGIFSLDFCVTVMIHSQIRFRFISTITSLIQSGFYILRINSGSTRARFRSGRFGFVGLDWIETGFGWVGLGWLV